MKSRRGGGKKKKREAGSYLHGTSCTGSKEDDGLLILILVVCSAVMSVPFISIILTLVVLSTDGPTDVITGGPTKKQEVRFVRIIDRK